MRKITLGLPVLLLTGCHSPASDFATLDVPSPSLASGWVQFRHEPGGYTFQAPATWVIDPQSEARAVIARTGSDAKMFLRILDLDAARRNDLVSFAVTRMVFPRDEVIKVSNLDDLSTKALQGMKMNSPDAKHERISLPIGPAEHLWASMDKTMPDGSHVRMISHIVVFATALRPFVVVYGYPAMREADYLPTLNTMLRSVRLIMPKANGSVEIPMTAHVPRRNFDGRTMNPGSTGPASPSRPNPREPNPQPGPGEVPPPTGPGNENPQPYVPNNGADTGGNTVPGAPGSGDQGAGPTTGEGTPPGQTTPPGSDPGAVPPADQGTNGSPPPVTTG